MGRFRGVAKIQERPLMAWLRYFLLDKRIPMTVNEVIEMYRIATPRIFQTDSKLQMFLNWLTNKIAGVPIYPYGQDGIGKSNL